MNEDADGQVFLFLPNRGVNILQPFLRPTFYTFVLFKALKCEK